MAKSLSPSLIPQQPDEEIRDGDLFVPNVFARADIEPDRQRDVEAALLATLRAMIPEIRQLIREEKPLTLKVIVAFEFYKTPRAPRKHFMG